MRIILGITGASGAIYGLRTLEELFRAGIETHLVISKWGYRVIRQETDYDMDAIRRMATATYDNEDLGAAVSSGSFIAAGMVIAPCSVKSLSAIANGYGDTLIARAAGVCLKEHRRLVVVPRESPLDPICLENLLKLARLRVSIIPPVVAFYSRPGSIDDIVNHTVGRVLDHLEIQHDLVKRWRGLDNPSSYHAAPAPCPSLGGATVVDSGDGSPEVCIGEGRLKVRARAWRTPGGIVAGLFGGESPHVGSVVVAVPRPSLADPARTSCTSSVINIPDHKEEEVLRPLAECLAKATGLPVACVGGIHIERADEDELAELVENCRKAGQALSQRLVGEIK